MDLSFNVVNDRKGQSYFPELISSKATDDTDIYLSLFKRHILFDQIFALLFLST